MLAARAEIFGDGGGRETGPDAQQRILVGCGDDDHRTLAPRFAERVEQFPNFASPLADQAEPGEVRAGVAGHHADQRAFADSTAAKNAHALASSAGEEGVDRPDAASERIANRSTLERQRS